MGKRGHNPGGKKRLTRMEILYEGRNVQDSESGLIH
jgi:hypothetical protein